MINLYSINNIAKKINTRFAIKLIVVKKVILKLVVIRNSFKKIIYNTNIIVYYNEN